MAQLRVAGVGAGYFAQFHLAGWKAIPEVDFVALCDRDEARARA
jgi:predicted dehydrogenase